MVISSVGGCHRHDQWLSRTNAALRDGSLTTADGYFFVANAPNRAAQRHYQCSSQFYGMETQEFDINVPRRVLPSRVAFANRR